MTDNKKLLKEFANILTSCNKAKQGAVAEIGKIDDKYRRLAEKEKEQLNALVKALDEQIKMYAGYLGLGENKPEEVLDEETEPVVEDTIFPENNEEEDEKVDEKPAEEAKENVEPSTGAAVEEAVVLEDLPEISAGEDVKWPEAEPQKIDENGWPEWPDV